MLRNGGERVQAMQSPEVVHHVRGTSRGSNYVPRVQHDRCDLAPCVFDGAFDLSGLHIQYQDAIAREPRLPRFHSGGSCYLASPSHIARDGRHGLVAQRVAPEDAASKSTLVCGGSAQNLRSTDPDITVGLRACGGNSDVAIQGWTSLPLAALNHRVAAPSPRSSLDAMD